MNLDAIVNLDLTAGIGVEGFPRLGTTLFVDWGFDAVLGAENAFDGDFPHHAVVVSTVDAANASLANFSA